MAARSSKLMPMAFFAASLMATDGTRLIAETENREPPPEPRPDEVEGLSRKQRKTYARVMRETQSREQALRAVKGELK